MANQFFKIPLELRDRNKLFATFTTGNKIVLHAVVPIKLNPRFSPAVNSSVIA